MAEQAIPPQNTALAAQAWLGTLTEVITLWLVAGEGRVTDALPDLRLLLLRSIGASDAGIPRPSPST